VPLTYHRVEIEYSKFGVEDFDFGFVLCSQFLIIGMDYSSSRCRFYNKTEYSGLETHILNSYTNPVVQVMHYCLPIRRFAKYHITTNCPREHCLLCELGFVVRMLEDATGINCQSSNFCKTVGVLAQGDLSPQGANCWLIPSFQHRMPSNLSTMGEMQLTLTMPIKFKVFIAF